MRKSRAHKRSDTTYPSLPVYWRRVLAISLSDLEEEVFISLHHPLQPERVLDALTRHSRLLRGMIDQGPLCSSRHRVSMPSREPREEDTELDARVYPDLRTASGTG